MIEKSLGTAKRRVSREHAMMAIRAIEQSKIREAICKAIVQLLTSLPECQRKIFVWNHYSGHSPKQIAEILGCCLSEIEEMLAAINFRLYQEVRVLLEEFRMPGSSISEREGKRA